MDKDTFKQLLKKAGLSNKELARILNTHPQTVNNWVSRGFPYWLETWLQNYIKAKTLDSVKDVICNDPSSPIGDKGNG